MKNHIILSLVLLAFANASAQSSARTGKDYAVFFYVTDFQPNWVALPETEMEAKALKEELETNFSFACELVTNPTKQQMRSKIREYNARLTADDQVLYFFSMHGYYSTSGDRGYLVGKDGLAADEYGDTWLSYDDLRTDLAPCKAKHVLLALDACHSGSFGIRNKGGPDVPVYDVEEDCATRISKTMQYSGRQFCTSGNKDAKTPAKSLFASRFLEALRKGGIGGIVCFDDLEYYLGKIEAPNPESGSFRGHEGGDFIFVRQGNCANNGDGDLRSPDLSAKSGVPGAPLNAGTMLILETSETINSTDAGIGTLIQLRVRTDVKSNNQVIVRAGTPALGRIKKIEKASYNYPECIVLEALLIKAVDGQQISVSGNEGTFCGQFNNESMELPPLQMLTAVTMNNVTIGEAKTDTTSFLWFSPAIIKPAGKSGRTATLVAGTSVMLEFQGNLDYTKLSGGEEINFTVWQRVVVNGNTMIDAGSVADGLITGVSREMEGYITITLEARHVYAIDGQKVLLYCTPHVIKVKADTKNISTYQAFKLRSSVQYDVKIRI